MSAQAGRDSHVKWVGMFVVSLRGVNYVFWYPFGYRRYFSLQCVFTVARKEINGSYISLSVLEWYLLGIKKEIGLA